jgi:hypothetical protein
MRGIRTLAASWLVVAAACAKGSSGGDDVDAAGGQIDAPQGTDATATDDAPAIDAPAIDAPAIDAAAIDAPLIDAALIDAAVIDAATIDAMVTDAATDARTDAAIDAGCTVTTVNILVNPALDLNPVGTGWVQTPQNAAEPIITDVDGWGIVEHTAPYKAWLGGYAVVATDVMYQDVTVPVGTTMLTVRGQYGVGTSEAGSTVYDSCTVQLQNTSGALLQSIMTVTNVGATGTASWRPFQSTFSMPYAGQTVRLHFRATTDNSLATAFFFDTLALEATVCQ